jgi:hypothetical protein
VNRGSKLVATQNVVLRASCHQLPVLSLPRLRPSFPYCALSLFLAQRIGVQFDPNLLDLVIQGMLTDFHGFHRLSSRTSSSSGILPLGRQANAVTCPGHTGPAQHWWCSRRIIFASENIVAVIYVQYSYDRDGGFWWYW